MMETYTEANSGQHEITEQESAWRRQDAGCARLVGDPRIESGAASCAFNQPINILRLPDVIKRVGLKRASIYLHIARGNFPKQISLGPRAVGWIEREIDVWLVARIQTRDGNGHESV